MVEEYHKAAETGAQIQERYNRTAARLERIVAILSIIAVRILQMKTIANRYPDRLAMGVVPRKWIVAMCAIQRLQFPNQKIYMIRKRLRGTTFCVGLPRWEAFLDAKVMANQDGS